ncbi:MAG: SOUL family heme-binding protein [Betaproteobacteria bacterium]
MKTLLKRSLMAIALAIVAFLSTLEPAMAVAEPPFTIERRDGDFELRDYPGFVVAETRVEGGFDEASRAGFRRVANYIFGGNVGPDGKPIKIAMTAPVTVEPAGGDQWRLHFVMPDDVRSTGLPKPADPSVNLREVPRHRMAAVRFGGFTTEASIAEHTAKLRDWIAAQGLQPAGEPQIARYNDPFTLPWNRRNEIMIPVR